ncbi:MAG: histidine--tRNA ligase [bacterium]
MIEKPKGTNDFLYPESSARQRVVSLITEIFEIFGYRPIETPIFEYSELFKISAGLASDIVSKEMYEFLDKKGRNLALRPEITAPVVRAIIQNNLVNELPIIKLYYVGSIFRYEKPQKDRYRQATQFGIEFLGLENEFADFEVIYLAHKIYQLLGIQTEIHLNTIGCIKCRINYRNQVYEYFKKYQSQLCKDCNRRLEQNPLRILDCKEQSCKNISLNSPKSIDYICTDCKKHFQNLLEHLSNHNIPIIQNPLLVRGLDYYNRTVFEVKYQGVDLAGGGRYDYLVSMISKDKYNIPAVGFAGGLERLVNTLQQNNLLSKILNEKTRIALISLCDKADKIILNLYMRISSKLTEKKINNEFEIHLLKFDNLSKALKSCNKLNLNYAIFVGEEEISNDEITIKNLDTGKQEKIKIESFLPLVFQNLFSLSKYSTNYSDF